jgi:hypothetical protein
MKFQPLLAALIFALSACAPKAVIVEPIAPAVIRARATASTAAASAVRVKTSVAEARTEAQEITREVMAATVEVDRLRKLDSGIAPGEFDALWTIVNGLSVKTSTHEKSIEEVSAVAEVASSQAEESKTALAELEATAITHDKGVETLKTEVVKQSEDAAAGRLVKKTFWTIAITAIVGVLLYLILRFGPVIAAKFANPLN